MSKIIGNTTTTPVPRSDWAQTDEKKVDFIKNKPILGALASQNEVAKEFLTADVQESLVKADSAIQSIDGLATEQYVDEHNVAMDSHNDIRLLLDGLTTRLNTLADSDDTTLDQMSEIVTYIKSNKDLIETITTNKVNVSDVINNLTTNVINKPLSAAQGVAIKNLIDTLRTTVNGKVDASSLNNYYTKTEINNLELITVEDIDAICGTIIEVARANSSEVIF